MNPRNGIRVHVMRFVILVLLALPAASVTAQEEEDRAGGAFKAFNLILERNIFDPERRPVTTAQDRPAPVARPQMDRMSLIGVFIDGEQRTAFFGGSNMLHLKLGESAAGYRITKIRSTSVTVMKDAEDGEPAGEEIELPMGAGFQRVGDGPWELTREVAVPAITESTSSSTSSGALSDEERAAKLKELMERRKKERS